MLYANTTSLTKLREALATNSCVSLNGKNTTLLAFSDLMQQGNLQGSSATYYGSRSAKYVAGMASQSTSSINAYETIDNVMLELDKAELEVSKSIASLINSQFSFSKALSKLDFTAKYNVITGETNIVSAMSDYSARRDYYDTINYLESKGIYDITYEHLKSLADSRELTVTELLNSDSVTMALSKGGLTLSEYVKRNLDALGITISYVDAVKAMADPVFSDNQCLVNISDWETYKQNLDSSISMTTLTQRGGIAAGPSGKETFYNMNMKGCIKLMCDIDSKYESWEVTEREDGVKLFGGYVMVAANLDVRPKGTIVQTSLGPGIVVDTGTFTTDMSNPHYKYQLDIAANWGNEVRG